MAFVEAKANFALLRQTESALVLITEEVSIYSFVEVHSLSIPFVHFSISAFLLGSNKFRTCSFCRNQFSCFFHSAGLCIFFSSLYPRKQSMFPSHFSARHRRFKISIHANSYFPFSILHVVVDIFIT